MTSNDDTMFLMDDDIPCPNELQEQIAKLKEENDKQKAFLLGKMKANAAKAEEITIPGESSAEED